MEWMESKIESNAKMSIERFEKLIKKEWKFNEEDSIEPKFRRS